MASPFDRAFRRLVVAFKRYQDVPRSPEGVAVIGEARWQLHLARNAIADERARHIPRRVGHHEIVRKVDVSDADAARLRVKAISAGFS